MVRNAIIKGTKTLPINFEMLRDSLGWIKIVGAFMQYVVLSIILEKERY